VTPSQKIGFLSFFNDFFSKEKEFVEKYSIFRKLCHHLAIFHPKNKSLIPVAPSLQHQNFKSLIC
jgi:hypothetical protein